MGQPEVEPGLARLRFGKGMGMHGRLLSGLVCWLLAPMVHAGNWTVTPALQWQELWSDNIRLAAPGFERADLVTQLTPAVRISGQGGRVKLNLDGAWQIMRYERGTSPSRSLPTLSSTASLEVVDNWFFLEGQASISQQAASAFGAQLARTANVNNNVTRTSNHSLSPYIHGTVGSDLTYDLRFRNTQTGSTSSVAANGSTGTNNNTEAWTGSLRWGTAARLFNVEASFSESSTTYSTNQVSTSSKYDKLTGYFNPDAHLVLFASVGRETNRGGLSLAANRTGVGPSRGMGLRWDVNPRTSLSVQRDWRYFGPSDHVSLTHRFERSALNVGYSRDRTTSQGMLQQSAGGSYYQLYSRMLAAAYPDPVQRDLAVRQLLVSQGLSGADAPVLGFLSDNILIQRALNISYAITGVRNTLTFLASRIDNRTDTVVSAADFLSTYTTLGQRSLSVTWGFKASPYSTLTASLTRLRSEGTTVNGLGTYTRQSSVNLLWNTQLTSHASGTVSLRHVLAEGSTAGTGTYKENAASATLGYRY